MPTPHAALVAVAAGLAGIDPLSDEAVEAFYTDTLPHYGADKRELIMDWLAATVTVPTPEEIAQLVRAIHPEAALRTEPVTRSSALGTREPLDPSHRSGGTRRVLQGVVVSDRGEKTVVVKVERRFVHPVMNKTVRRTTTYRAHDAANAARLGQTVRIEKTAPNSRTWELVDDRGDAAPTPHS